MYYEMTDNLYIGTWNVMTLLKPGKLHETGGRNSKNPNSNIGVTGRWPGKGQINKKDYLLYCSAHGVEI